MPFCKRLFWNFSVWRLSVRCLLVALKQIKSGLWLLLYRLISERSRCRSDHEVESRYWFPPPPALLRFGDRAGLGWLVFLFLVLKLQPRAGLEGSEYWAKHEQVCVFSPWDSWHDAFSLCVALAEDPGYHPVMEEERMVSMVAQQNQYRYAMWWHWYEGRKVSEVIKERDTETQFVSQRPRQNNFIWILFH